MKITATPERLRLLGIAAYEGGHPDGYPPASLHLGWWELYLAADWARELDRKCWLEGVRSRLGLVTCDGGVPLVAPPRAPDPADDALRRRAERLRQHWLIGQTVQPPRSPFAFVTTGICP